MQATSKPTDPDYTLFCDEPEKLHPLASDPDVPLGRADLVRCWAVARALSQWAVVGNTMVARARVWLSMVKPSSAPLVVAFRPVVGMSRAVTVTK
ncbi:hypothetical protein P3T36_005256 [Kitasatospora sp. MAP12-15]|nr:hypothetical protein [Kitasatospora sp. MAP12-44]